MKWKNGFYFDDQAPEGAIEITDERYEELIKGQTQGLTIEEQGGLPVLVDYRLSAEEKALSELRARRASECFSVIDRSILWHNRLTEEQKTELNVWYQAWLNVTETKVVPEKPVWLEEK